MASNLDMLRWLLKQGVKSAKDNIAFYIDNPGDAPVDLWEWVKENKLTCCLIVGGVLVIVIPLAIGFGPAGPILGSIAAGWQSGIGAVAAGSVFATLQSMAMTGAFTAIGASLIGGGFLKWFGDGLMSGEIPKLLMECHTSVARDKSLSGLSLSFQIAGGRAISIGFPQICPKNKGLAVESAQFSMLQAILDGKGHGPGTYNLTWEKSDSYDIITIRNQKELVDQLRIFLEEGQTIKPVPVCCHYRLEAIGRKPRHSCT